MQLQVAVKKNDIMYIVQQPYKILTLLFTEREGHPIPPPHFTLTHFFGTTQFQPYNFLGRSPTFPPGLTLLIFFMTKMFFKPETHLDQIFFYQIVF